MSTWTILRLQGMILHGDFSLVQLQPNADLECLTYLLQSFVWDGHFDFVLFAYSLGCERDVGDVGDDGGQG